MTETVPAHRMAAPAMVRRRLPSLIWLVPVIAAVVGAWLVAQSWLEQGPEIKIRFASAGGVEAGKTRIRYKEVDIGKVKAVDLSEDRKSAVVTAQLSKEARDLLAADSQFYIVLPRISAGSISGLSTLLSGPYIGLEPGAAPERARSFVGLESPPVVMRDVPGREFVLRGDNGGSLDYGTPVFYRRIEVGLVTRLALQPDGQGVEVSIFVKAPYDRFVTGNTRFWQASGIDVAVDSNGLKVSTQSLASIVEGGIAFQDLADSVAAGEPAPAKSVFDLYADRAQALQPPDTHKERFTLYFPESLRGLSVGAAVDFRGIVIGEVKSMGVEYERTGGLIRFPVTVEIYPDRLRSRSLGEAPKYNEVQSRMIIDRLVAHGLRAQLRTGSLLTGQLYVALDFFRDAPQAAVQWAQAQPVLPTRPGGLSQIQESVAQIAAKVDRLPLEQIAGQVSQVLASMDQSLKDSRRLIGRLDGELVPQANRTLRQAEQALRNANDVLSQSAPVPQDVQQALREVAASARSVEQLADYLERHPESLLRGKPKDMP